MRYLSKIIVSCLALSVLQNTAQADEDSERPKPPEVAEPLKNGGRMPGDYNVIEKRAPSHRPDDDEPSWHAGLSAGLMGGSLAIGAGLAFNENTRWVAAGFGGFGLLLAPTVGRLSGGDFSGSAMHFGLRVGLSGAAFSAVYFVKRSSVAEAEPNRDRDAALTGLAAGGVTMLALALWDVTTIEEDLARKRVRARVVPMPVGSDGAMGVGVVGTF